MRALGEGHPGKRTARSRRNRRRNSPSSREPALQRRETGAGSELGGPTPPPLRQGPAQPGLSSPPAGPGTPRAAAAAAPCHRRPPDRTGQTSPEAAPRALHMNIYHLSSPCISPARVRPPLPPLPRATSPQRSRPPAPPPAPPSGSAPWRDAALTAGTAPSGGAVRVCVSARARPARAVPSQRIPAGDPGAVDVLASLTSSPPVHRDGPWCWAGSRAEPQGAGPKNPGTNAFLEE